MPTFCVASLPWGEIQNDDSVKLTPMKFPVPFTLLTTNDTRPPMFLVKSYVMADSPERDVVPVPLSVRPIVFVTDPFAWWMVGGTTVRDEGARIYSEYGTAQTTGRIANTPIACLNRDVAIVKDSVQI